MPQEFKIIFGEPKADNLPENHIYIYKPANKMAYTLFATHSTERWLKYKAEEITLSPNDLLDLDNIEDIYHLGTRLRPQLTVNSYEDLFLANPFIFVVLVKNPDKKYDELLANFGFSRYQADNTCGIYFCVAGKVVSSTANTVTVNVEPSIDSIIKDQVLQSTSFFNQEGIGPLKRKILALDLTREADKNILIEIYNLYSLLRELFITIEWLKLNYPDVEKSPVLEQSLQELLEIFKTHALNPSAQYHFLMTLKKRITDISDIFLLKGNQSRIFNFFKVKSYLQLQLEKHVEYRLLSQINSRRDQLPESLVKPLEMKINDNTTTNNDHFISSLEDVIIEFIDSNMKEDESEEGNNRYIKNLDRSYRRAYEMPIADNPKKPEFISHEVNNARNLWRHIYAEHSEKYKKEHAPIGTTEHQASMLEKAGAMTQNFLRALTPTPNNSRVQTPVQAGLLAPQLGNFLATNNNNANNASSRYRSVSNNVQPTIIKEVEKGKKPRRNSLAVTFVLPTDKNDDASSMMPNSNSNSSSSSSSSSSSNSNLGFTIPKLTFNEDDD